MPLVKVCRAMELAEGQRVIRDSYDVTLIITRRNGQLICVELPDAAYSNAEFPEHVPGARMQQLYEDSDGFVWIQYVQQPKPVVDKKQTPSIQGFGMGSFLSSHQGPQAPPLLPFAGYNMVPMPPSPAKPEQDLLQAEAAIQAKQRSWANRQASIKEFFSTTSDF